MATQKQREAAKQNIKKAQKKWESMTHREHALAQPQGRGREKPGETGQGEYFRVVLRPKDEFVTFRNQDVGEKGGDLQRLAGKRQSGSWDTQAWLVNKHSAHIEGDHLVADTDDVRDLFNKLGSTPKRVDADIFAAKPRRDVPESEKPTAAQKRARHENIKKAQQARWHHA